MGELPVPIVTPSKRPVELLRAALCSHNESALCELMKDALSPDPATCSDGNWSREEGIEFFLQYSVVKFQSATYKSNTLVEGMQYIITP